MASTNSNTLGPAFVEDSSSSTPKKPAHSQYKIAKSSPRKDTHIRRAQHATKALRLQLNLALHGASRSKDTRKAEYDSDEVIEEDDLGSDAEVKGDFRNEDPGNRSIRLSDTPQYPLLAQPKNEAAAVANRAWPVTPTGQPEKKHADEEEKATYHGLPEHYYEARGDSPNRPTETEMDRDTQRQLHQSPFDNRVGLQALALVNRAANTTAQIEYPAEFLDALNRAQALQQTQVRASGATIPMAGCSTISVSQHTKIYTCVEENTHVQPFFNVLGNAMDLRLANELALERFRSAVYKHFPDLLRGLDSNEIKKSWINANRDISGESRLAWWVDEDGCITLSAGFPGTEYQMHITVMGRPLALRTGA